MQMYLFIMIQAWDMSFSNELAWVVWQMRHDPVSSSEPYMFHLAVPSLLSTSALYPTLFTALTLIHVY